MSGRDASRGRYINAMTMLNDDDDRVLTKQDIEMLGIMLHAGIYEERQKVKEQRK